MYKNETLSDKKLEKLNLVSFKFNEVSELIKSLAKEKQPELEFAENKMLESFMWIERFIKLSKD